MVSRKDRVFNTVTKHMIQKIYSNIAILSVSGMLGLLPVATSAQTCSYMVLPQSGYIASEAVEVAKLQVFLDDIAGYSLGVTGVYDAPTDTAARAFLDRQGVFAQDVIDNSELVREVNAVVCGERYLGVTEAQNSNTNDQTATSVGGYDADDATSTPPGGVLQDDFENSALAGTPVGFVNEFSLPILIVLFLLVGVQIIYMWGVAPRRRMQLIPRGFK
jgi:hypothetical protein